MEKWRKDNRKEVVMTDIEGIVPKGHLLRKIRYFRSLFLSKTLKNLVQILHKTCL